MPTAQYVRKPVVFTAIQWNGSNQDEVIAFCPWCKYDGSSMIFDDPNTREEFHIQVGHWVMANEVGMWMPYLAPDFLSFYAPAPANVKTKFLMQIE